MPGTREQSPIGWKVGLLPLACCVLLAAIGYLPTQSFGDSGATRAMFVAQFLVVLIVYASFFPAMRRMVEADANRRFLIALKAGMIRLFVTVPAAAIIALQAELDTSVFLIWVAITYVVLIKAETIALVLWSRHLDNLQRQP